jgi:hypothetical protein
LYRRRHYSAIAGRIERSLISGPIAFSVSRPIELVDLNPVASGAAPASPLTPIKHWVEIPIVALAAACFAWPG